MISYKRKPCFWVVIFLLLVSIGLPVACSGENSMDEAWQAYRAQDFQKAERLFIQLLSSATTESKRACIIERLAFVYVAMELDPTVARGRLSLPITDQDLLESLMRSQSSPSETSKPKVDSIERINDHQNSATPRVQDLEVRGDRKVLRSDAATDHVDVYPSQNSQRFAHLEKAPPVDPKLRAGNRLSENDLRQFTSPNNWFKISEADAGVWESEPSTMLLKRDYQDSIVMGALIAVAGQTVTTPKPDRVKSIVFVSGYQRDKSGQIWNYVEARRPDDSNPLFTRYDSLDVFDRSKGVTREVGMRLFVSKADGIIQGSFRVENITRKTEISAGALRWYNRSTRVFDENGKPVIDMQTTWIGRKRAPFQTMDNYQGKDMHALFCDYLGRHGLSSIVNSGRDPKSTARQERLVQVLCWHRT